MSSTKNSNSSEMENMCVVCFKNVDIYSIGICDHPVCFECSTRMRVLCRQNECPICRQDMPKVVFCNEIRPFRNLKSSHHQHYNNTTQLVDRKFGIWFETPFIQKAYYQLLEHNCTKCNRHEPFRNFHQLKEHMRKEHELFYCDLCVENLRIFTWERRCYNRADLAQHRRKGDPDNTSHRGHPLCQFCDTRYMDNDELFRHLRRDHLFCHFCDADGLHHYYPTYDCLRDHFKAEHYLCEEGDCINEKFTSVFRSEIDLKAHRASVHGKYLGKAASKQARTLELEFTLAPRPRVDQVNRGGRKPQSASSQNESNVLQDEGAVGCEHTIQNSEPGGSRGITLTAQDFPSLGGGNSANIPPLRAPGSNVTIRHIRRGQEALARTNENFPALSGDSSTLRLSVNTTSSVVDHLQTTSNTTPNVSIHVNHRPNGAITTHISQNTTSTIGSVKVRPRIAAFPALGSVTIPEAQWVKLSKNNNQQPKEPKPKISKVAPAPLLPSRDSPTDFPSLNNNFNNNNKTEQKVKKSTTVTMPVNNYPETSDSNKAVNNKKKKKSKTGNESPPQNNQIIKTTSASEPKIITNNNTSKKEKETKKEEKQNGLVKKRSELKIDSLHIDDPSTSNGHEDFPSLTSNNKPPPGFVVQAPPGFAANDLTFTNSSGQSYSILPTHQFSPPPNFSQRNKKLVESFMTSLSSNDAILEFKNLSGLFRNGLYSAESYYEHCKEVMKNDFGRIFPELLVLLPDINKQQELYAIHCKKSANKKGFDVCATCRQVMSSSDLRSHLAVHTLDNHFPALGTQETSSVWKK